ncbi:single-stranded DNA-binding protein [Phytoactinopolyspora alkaliphila]|uniref:Single-stranded DNA-binding protein n=2 Tax=Phytoactinopolyspora alkaliphila TaxID=1783498 RepID=A0A6N9YQZ4_9ACTN|nr:single-stranded DNA-binding protein [Phytoactinopolyspora alkaliphila]
MTVSGNVATTVRREVKKDGDPWCHFRIACNERYFDSRTNQWSDGETSYFTVICWQPHLAKNVAASLSLGDPVVVHGRGRVREWRDEQNVLRQSIEISASSVGHDLYRGISSFTKAVRQPPSEPDGDEVKQAVAGYTTDEAGADKATGEVPPPPLPSDDNQDEPDDTDEFDDSDELTAVGAAL